MTMEQISQRTRRIATIGVSVLLLVGAAGAIYWMYHVSESRTRSRLEGKQPPARKVEPGLGADTPDEAFAMLRDARENQDFPAILRLMSPPARLLLWMELISTIRKISIPDRESKLQQAFAATGADYAQFEKATLLVANRTEPDPGQLVPIPAVEAAFNYIKQYAPRFLPPSTTPHPEQWGELKTQGDTASVSVRREYDEPWEEQTPAAPGTNSKPTGQRHVLESYVLVFKKIDGQWFVDDFDGEHPAPP